LAVVLALRDTVMAVREVFAVRRRRCPTLVIIIFLVVTLGR